MMGYKVSEGLLDLLVDFEPSEDGSKSMDLLDMDTKWCTTSLRYTKWCTGSWRYTKWLSKARLKIFAHGGRNNYNYSTWGSK